MKTRYVKKIKYYRDNTLNIKNWRYVVVKIEIVSGDNCVGCKKLIKALEDKAIKFTVYDRKSDEGKELLKRYGVSSIPLTVVSKGNFEKHFVGSSIRKITTLYNNMLG